MDKREFLKASGGMLASTLFAKLIAAQPTEDSRTNWAGNYTYSTKNLDLPNNIEDIRHCKRLSSICAAGHSKSTALQLSIVF